MLEAIRFPKISVLTKATLCQIPEDGFPKLVVTQLTANHQLPINSQLGKKVKLSP
jgi:hypothetical protein